MGDTEQQLKKIKSMLRSTLISSKEGIPARKLLHDYEALTQEPLSFKSLGFNSLEEFIQSIPDVVDIRRNSAGDIILHAVADESNKHILKLVSKQKMKKTRKLSAPRKLSPKTKWTQSKWEASKSVPWHTRHKQPLLTSPPIPTQRRSVFERLGSRPKVQEHEHVGVSKSAIAQYKNITDFQIVRPRRSVFERLGPRPKIHEHDHIGGPNFAQDNIVNFQIEISHTPSGRGHGRRVQSGGSKRMFNAAMSDVANDRQTNIASKYELPPRFRQQQAEMPDSAYGSDGASGGTESFFQT